MVKDRDPTDPALVPVLGPVLGPVLRESEEEYILARLGPGASGSTVRRSS